MEIKNKKQIFLVLVPHRDARAALKKLSESLIKSGINNIYNFPFAAPLAALLRPLSTDELKKIACSIREIKGDKKFNHNNFSSVVFPAGDEKMTLYGPRLDLQRQPDYSGCTGKIDSVFPNPVSGIFLEKIPEYKAEKQYLTVQERENEYDSLTDFVLKDKNELSFRPAAIANMYWQPIRQGAMTIYKWKIGKLCWLPNPGKKQFLK
ncbi:MAG: hypothetical protein FWD40_06830 [Treponema sp.]|nr:hypothetical protein [Treponema sp.]